MISILIPTLNRSEFVARLLRYYASVHFDGWVCLGDSSNEVHAARNRALVQEYAGRLNIRYCYYPSPPYINDGLCLRALIEEAPTPYAVYSGDDDLLVPAGLERCMEFLAANPGYSAAGGIGVSVTLEARGASGRALRAHYMGAHQLHADRAADRWRGYVHQAISTQYFVHARETWRRMYQDLPQVPVRYLGPEFLPCSWSAILGKITTLNELSYVFQSNATERPFGWNTHSFYGLMLNPNWTPAVQTVRASLTRGLREVDGLTQAEAEAVFDQEFWNHMLFMLDWHFMVHYPASFRNAYDYLRRQKKLLNLYMRLKNWRNRKEHVEITLAGLLRPDAQYHATFMPAYRAMTGEQVDAH